MCMPCLPFGRIHKVSCLMRGCRHLLWSDVCFPDTSTLQRRRDILAGADPRFGAEQHATLRERLVRHPKGGNAWNADHVTAVYQVRSADQYSTYSREEYSSPCIVVSIICAPSYNRNLWGYPYKVSSGTGVCSFSLLSYLCRIQTFV